MPTRSAVNPLADGWCALLGDAAQVEHLLGAGHYHDLAATVLLLALGGVVGRDRIGGGEASGAPFLLRQPAIFYQIEEHLAGP